MVYHDANIHEDKYPETQSSRHYVEDYTHDDHARNRPSIRSESGNYRELWHVLNETEEIPNDLPRSTSHNAQEPYAIHMDASANHPQMNHTFERRTYAENSAEINSQQWQRADTYPASFHYHYEQEPHRHSSNQGTHAHGHNPYNLYHQSSSVANNVRSGVPQPMSYATGAYRCPGVFPPTDIAPAWHQYNGMMRRYEVPPHYQQYPQ
eukprot:15345223-Ditylum_brightwellii.AAC.1